MALKPQDILVALKLLLDEELALPFSALASDLGMSASETHAALRRLQEGKLGAGSGRRIQRQALRNLLAHGVAAVFPAREGEPSRGIPTAWAAPVLRGSFAASSDPKPVWPHPDGTDRGPSVAPLYKSAPAAALKDPRLYAYLALIDALRLGRARDRSIALAELDKRLLPDG